MRTLAVAVIALATLAACGGGGGGGGSTQPAGSIKVTMTEFKFDPAAISASSGNVVFYVVNAGSVAHDLVIRDASGKRVAASELVSAGDSKVFTVSNITAGKYTTFCDQQGHEASGMVGTLTVT